MLTSVVIPVIVAFAAGMIPLSASAQKKDASHEQLVDLSEAP